MNSPIGILDSGLGGLSILNEIRAVLPNESIIYFGDSAWCPYGARHADEIQRRVFAVTDFLIEQGFVTGKASPCNFRHKTRDIAMAVHGDDFTCSVGEVDQ